MREGECWRGDAGLVGRSTVTVHTRARTPGERVHPTGGTRCDGQPQGPAGTVAAGCETARMTHHDLLGGPAPTLLPADGPDATVRAALAADGDARSAARATPASSLAWALLAEQETDAVAAYAYARTGYHRGLDALRRAGWRGQGPVPASHQPNQGFLRALLALAEAADAIGEQEEAERCARFLVDSATSADEVRALR